jgi:hypothetical protein
MTFLGDQEGVSEVGTNPVGGRDQLGNESDFNSTDADSS